MRATPAFFAFIPVLFAVACGGDEGDGNNIEGNGGGGASGAGGSQTGGVAGTTIIVQGGTGVGASSGAGGSMVVTTLPPDFTATNIGGYKLGDPIEGMPMPPAGSACNNLLTGVVRDFRGMPDGHPNFEMDIDAYGVYEGMVNGALGSNQKPVFSGMVTEEVATNATDFDQWYLNTDDVNRPHYLTVFLEPRAGGIYTFHSDSFFPLDGAGWNDESVTDDGTHNFFFTFELHTTFEYHGGETFTFIGDDDVWVFINGQLAVDIGGVHSEVEESINLDDEASNLGIQVGRTYPLDMFHAERHTSQSNFRIDTTLSFNCSVFVPDVPR